MALEIYQLSDGFPKKYLYDLTNQLRRAALSVPTNLAEGCASPHSGELLQFINISRRSLSETRYLIEFASKLGLVGPEKSKELERLCTEKDAGSTYPVNQETERVIPITSRIAL